MYDKVMKYKISTQVRTAFHLRNIRLLQEEKMEESIEAYEEDRSPFVRLFHAC